MVEHYSDTVGVAGSNPSVTTSPAYHEMSLVATLDREVHVKFRRQVLSGGVTANIPEFGSGVTGSNPVLMANF